MPQTRSIDRSRARRRGVLLAAVATVALAGLSAAPASAQYRVPQRGDALDANNRVGESRSYGSIQPRDDRYRLGNNIVTGDVTGGRGFRGPVPYGSVGGFRDFTSGLASDAFISRSTGVLPSGQVINNAQQVRPFYGGSQIVAPPPGYQQVPGTGGYMAPSALQPLDSRIDGRVYNYFAGDTNALDTQLDLNLSADRPARPEAGDPWTNVGPLLAPGDEMPMSRSRALSPYTRLTSDARLQPLTPQRLRELRSELLRDADGNPLTDDVLRQLSGARAAEGSQETSGLSSAANPQVEGQAEGGRMDAPLAGTARERLDETLRGMELHLLDPARQSAQYAQMQERLRQYRESAMANLTRPVGPDRRPAAVTPDETQTEPGDDEQPMTPPGGAGQEQQPLVPGLPFFLPQPQLSNVPAGGGELPGGDLTDPQPAVPPVLIGSLADGITSPTLKELYTQAEELMAEGRFVSAIARFDAAERVVPNQPLTVLGRATAEIGAGYYRRAAVSLQQAFAQNPELTMARLNLERMVGQDRLEEVQTTLQARLESDQQDPDSAFLLAFIAYHSGDGAAAVSHLREAGRRSGDPFYRQLADVWGGGPAEPQAPAGDVPATRPSTRPADAGDLSK